MQFQKNPYSPQGQLTEIPRGKGVSKAQFYKGKYYAKLEFPEGWVGGGGGGEVQTLNPSLGGVWLFSGTT